MTGPAHIAVGAACYAMTRHPFGLVAGILLHPALDLWGTYHPARIFGLDTWQKRTLFYTGFACCAALILRGFWLANLAGVLAWVCADYAWAVRELWPKLDRYNPHRAWWVKGWEFREQMAGFWFELGLMLAATAVAMLA